MSLERVEMIVDALLTEATEKYAIGADMPPSIFAIGRREVVIAIAGDNDGRKVTLETATGLLSLMARQADAVYLARIDSGFIQADDDVDGDPQDLEPGDISKRADIDPTISTVLLCEGYDSETDTSVLHVARLTLDDEGLPDWERLSVPDTDGMVARSLRTAYLASKFLSGRYPYRKLKKVANGIHWSLTRAKSKIGRVRLPGEQ